ASELAGHAGTVTCLPLDRARPEQLASCDVLVVGTWVEGLGWVGVGPARETRAWIARLPRIAGKPVAVFCTFAISPKATLAKMSTMLGAKGAMIVAEASFGPWELSGGHVRTPAAFSEEIVAKVLGGVAHVNGPV
ncbi:MAG: flavodoxin family protein, partial [Acidimicrobiales bacterium]